MKELLSVTVPKLFEGVQYGIRLHSASGKTREHKHVVHLDCGTSFWVDEPVQYIFYREVESIPVCPHCGRQIVTRNVIGDGGEDGVPVSAKFSVYDCKNSVKICIRYRVVVLHDFGDETPHEFVTRREIIQFHVDTGISTLTVITKEGRTVHNIANPFRMDLYNQSYLRFFNRDNFSKEFRGELSHVLTATRQAIVKKFRRIHGFPLKSIYVSRSDGAGYLYYPILNIAFRLSYPDARNLPSFFADVYYTTDRSARANMIGIDAEGLHCLDHFFQRDAYKTGNPVTDLLHSFALSDTPFNRRILTQDMFSVGRLKQIQNLTRNPDFQHVLYQRIRAEDVYHDLKYLLDMGFPEQKMIHLVCACFDEQGKDLSTASMFRCILSCARTILEHKGLIRLNHAPSNPTKLSAMLSREAFRIEHPNKVLPVPEEVRRQLSSQIGDARFYLPQNTWQLKSAAETFHNCVFSYCNSLINQECRIVFMADHNGALVACLELRQGKLVQARLRFNRPVSEDPIINSAVIAWCEKAGLQIQTETVQVASYVSESA